jgi:hypothetical protein
MPVGLEVEGVVRHEAQRPPRLTGGESGLPLSPVPGR